MIITSAPGKLYIAGEYAITQPNKNAILMAVNKFIYVKLIETFGEKTIESFSEQAIPWKRNKSGVSLYKNDSRFNYILESINIVEKYALEKGKKIKDFSIITKSELQSKNKKKYGLGSSAAITVASVEAICKLYDLNISKLELFKLSSMVHIKLNTNGSMGDIASSVYGGFISYTSFDKEFIRDCMKNKNITQILKYDWPYLSIEELEEPTNIKILIGWTKTPSSTYNLVKNINYNIKSKKEEYSKFLLKADESIKSMIEAFKNNDIEKIQLQILNYRKLLVKLGNDFNEDIETPDLKFFADRVLKYGGAGKLSGAGGGDCGIAIFKKENNISNLILELEKQGIEYLNLNTYYRKEK